jgi:Protein of unknown function (DUF3617)
MRTSMTWLGLGLLALAGCGGPEKADGNGSADSAKAGDSASAGAAAGVKLRPGEWETTVETLKVDAPGMPKEMAGLMAGQQKMTMRSCITAAQAEQPSGDLFRGKNDGKCQYEGFDVSGGRVKGKMTCSGGGQPGSVTLEMDGRYGGESYEVNQKMRTDAQGMAMTIESRVTARRVGDCPAGGQG